MREFDRDPGAEPAHGPPGETPDARNGATTPRVSVIVPFRNAARFLTETLESVFAQTYSDWELLLADDGSSDASTAIALACAARHPGRVRYLAHAGHAHRGPNPTRGLALAHARGEYIALLDADDVWVPQKLAEQVRLLDAHPSVGMLYGATRYWFGWTGAPSDAARDFVPELGFPDGTVVQPPDLVTRVILRQEGAVPCTGTILARRRLVIEVGGFDDHFADHEDQCFYVRMMLAAPVLVSRACWDAYRQHPDSAYARLLASRQTRAARVRFLAWVRAYLRASRVRDDAIFAALRAAVWRIRFRQVRDAIGAVRGLAGMQLSPLRS